MRENVACGSVEKFASLDIFKKDLDEANARLVEADARIEELEKQKVELKKQLSNFD